MHPIWNIPAPATGIRTTPIVLFDDFMLPSISATLDAAQWFATIGGTGDAFASLETIVGGAILLTSASDAEVSIESNGGGFCVPNPGKSLYFEARLRVADVTIANGQLFVGLGSIADVAPIAGDTSKIGFSRKTADASIWWTIGDTLTDTGLDMTAATFFTVAFKISNGTCYYYVDLETGLGPQLVGKTTSLPASTTLLSPKLALGLSAANAQTATWDSVLVIQDR